MVPKEDGSTRVCIDFRKVNDVSRFDAYPMPRVTELLERLGGAKYLTTIDLTKGYWQIPLEQKSKEYTAFATPVGLYQFVRMPFGLHGAAATFQRLMDKILAPHQGYAAAYIDDVVIYSDSWEDHLKHLRYILTSIQEAGLTVNPTKCRVGMKRTKFLGFLIGGGQVKPLNNKIEAINRIQAPKNKREVQRLLGMIGYYRRFIPQYSEITAPITDLTRGPKGRELQWTPECEAALARLKTALSQPPVLATPRFELPFVVHTDASGRGLGAVLSQIQDGEEKPIMYMSRKLNEAERKYSTIEREALAVKWAVVTLKYYLLGAPFTLVTDHAPLTWLQRMKDSNTRLTRWYLSLQPFAFQIQHRKGAEHSNADFLSRQEDERTWRSGDVAPVLPGGECEGQRQTEEEELAEDLYLMDVAREDDNRDSPCLCVVTHSRGRRALGGIVARAMYEEERLQMVEEAEALEREGREPPTPPTPPCRRARRSRRSRRQREEPEPFRRGGRLPGTQRYDDTPVWWLNTPPPPRPEWWNPPPGRGIWRE